jgi:hypothetical protein
MAARKRAARRGAKPEKLVSSMAEIAAALVALVEREGAVAKTEVAKHAGRERSLEVFDALGAAGLEIGARSIRRPLEEQLEHAVREGPLPCRGLEKHVAGASPREAKDAAAALIQRGRVRRVVHEKELSLASAGTPVLDARAREKLTLAVTALTTMLRLAARKDATLLRADVDAMLAPLVRGTAPAATASGDVTALIDAHRESSGLTSVPKLVRLLGGAPARDAVHAELLRGARAGRLELRPESGMGRLSADDAALCIPGPQGSRLSWVRRIEESA